MGINERDTAQKWYLYDTLLLSSGQSLYRSVRFSYSRDGVDHVQSHLYAAVGVVGLGLGQAGYAVVTVSQDLNTPAVVLLSIKGMDAQDVGLLTA